MLILSGLFGLLSPEDPIPWYDHPLAADEVPALAECVSLQLRERGITEVELHALDESTPGWAPYYAVMHEACAMAGIGLVSVLVSGRDGELIMRRS